MLMEEMKVVLKDHSFVKTDLHVFHLHNTGMALGTVLMALMKNAHQENFSVRTVASAFISLNFRMVLTIVGMGQTKNVFHLNMNVFVGFLVVWIKNLLMMASQIVPKDRMKGT